MSQPAKPSKSSLSSLAPIDGRSFGRSASLWLVWGSILLVWVVSLLPWRNWQPSPDLLLLVLAFWSLHEPRRIHIFTAAFFGLVMDVHDAAPLGGHALVYGLVVYGVVTLSRRLHRFNAVVQALHVLPIFVLAQAVYVVIGSWFAGHWLGWSWFESAVFTVLLWPVADILLHYLPHRLHDDIDSASA